MAQTPYISGPDDKIKEEIEVGSSSNPEANFRLLCLVRPRFAQQGNLMYSGSIVYLQMQKRKYVLRFVSVL
jgi:hypothetical protein